MQRFALLLVFLAFGPSLASAQELRGRVLDQRLDSPIAAARVSLLDADGRALTRTVTDATGRFVFERVPDQRFTVRVEAFGYAAAAERVIDPADLPEFLDVLVDPEPLETEGIRVSVSPGAAPEPESRWRDRVQFITGQVKDARSQEAIEAMDVVLRDVQGELAGRTLSDVDGRFGFRVNNPGLYRVAVSRFGYDSTATATLAVSPEQNLYVELYVQPAALGLDPIRVVAPRVLPYLESTGFYSRQQRGQGDFLGPRDLERTPGAFPRHVLRRLPGIRVDPRGGISVRGVGLGGSCRPTIVLDYMRMGNFNLDDVPLHQIEAMEIYRGPATIPPQWRDPGTCAVIAVWTKH